MPKLDDTLQIRYKALAQRAIVELIVKVFKAFDQHSKDVHPQMGIYLLPENVDLVPGLVDALFDQLFPAQRGRLMEALVRNLEL